MNKKKRTCNPFKMPHNSFLAKTTLRNLKTYVLSPVRKEVKESIIEEKNESLKS